MISMQNKVELKIPIIISQILKPLTMTGYLLPIMIGNKLNITALLQQQHKCTSYKLKASI